MNRQYGVPRNERNDAWLFVGWANISWSVGTEVEDFRKKNDSIDLGLLVVLNVGSKHGPRFYVHKDLIDD